MDQPAPPNPKDPKTWRCPHGFPIEPDAKRQPCNQCEDDWDMVLERLRWGER